MLFDLLAMLLNRVLMPFIDLTVNQLTAIIFGLMAVAVFMFYAYLYAPALPEKPEEEPEPPRKAQFFYKKPAEVPVEEAQAPYLRAAAASENKRSSCSGSR